MDASEQRFLASYWWVLTLRGVASLLFGIAAVFWPGLTLVTLVYLFSAYILVSGVMELVHGLSAIGRRSSWIFTVLVGFLEVGVGVYLIRHPKISFATIILLIGFTFIVRGVFEAVMAFSDNRSSTNRALMMIGGLAAVLAGIIVLFQPVAGGVAFVWIIGLMALIEGPILIALSLDAKHVLDDDSSTKVRRA